MFVLLTILFSLEKRVRLAAHPRREVVWLGPPLECRQAFG